jgi:hypothetical protein
MDIEAAVAKALKAQKNAPGTPPPSMRALIKDLKPTVLAPDAPAPRLHAMVDSQGPELTRAAVAAWDARVRGEPIVDIAHDMGMSIQGAKALINQAHAAIAEDLKDAVDRNRQLDLARIDGLLQTYYLRARQGDYDSANVVIKCMGHRAKLTGIEPLPAPQYNGQPQNVLVWIQNQLPTINKIVDALPLE